MLLVPIYSLVHTIFRCQLSGVISIILLRFSFQRQPVVLSSHAEETSLIDLGMPWKTRPLKSYMLLGNHFTVPFYPLSHLHQWFWTLCSRIVQESFIASLCLKPFEKTLILLFWGSAQVLGLSNLHRHTTATVPETWRLLCTGRLYPYFTYGW